MYLPTRSELVPKYDIAEFKLERFRYVLLPAATLYIITYSPVSCSYEPAPPLLPSPSDV